MQNRLPEIFDCVNLDNQGKVWTTSRKVAEKFGKRHDRVLRAIDNLISDFSEDFNHPNFGVVKYLDSKSEERREYRLSYKGFMAVAMSFTGKEAGRWKEKFIQAFETAMEIYERARSGDITLADQIANLATDEQTKWLIARQTGKVMRNQQTNVLKEHGVYGIGYAMCTNNTYRPLLGGTAKEVKEIRGLPAKTSLRDNLSMEELTGVTYAETITLRKIQEKNLQGNLDCAHEHLVVAEKVAEARR